MITLNGNFYTKRDLMNHLKCTKQQLATLQEKSFVDGLRIGNVLLFDEDDLLKLSQAKSLVRGYGL